MTRSSCLPPFYLQLNGRNNIRVTLRGEKTAKMTIYWPRWNHYHKGKLIKPVFWIECLHSRGALSVWAWLRLMAPFLQGDARLLFEHRRATNHCINLHYTAVREEAEGGGNLVSPHVIKHRNRSDDFFIQFNSKEFHPLAKFWCLFKHFDVFNEI